MSQSAVLMSGNADAKTLDRLENCFEWNRDRKLIWKIRKEVEDFERWTEKKVAEMLRAKRQQPGVSIPIPPEAIEEAMKHVH